MVTPGKISLLLIDSHSDTLRALPAILPLQAMSVIMAQDSTQGYRKAVSQKPDMILLAVAANNQGMACLRKLKGNALTARIPVMTLVSDTAPANRLAMFHNGAIDCIPEPVLPEELLARIRIHLNLVQITLSDDTLDPAQTITEDEMLIDSAKRFIQENLRQISSTRTVAIELGVSDRRLIEVFRSMLNTSPFEYLRGERMQRAKQLLRTTTLNQAAIAVEIGYSSAANFSTAFREFTSLTPASYRRDTLQRRRSMLR